MDRNISMSVKYPPPKEPLSLNTLKTVSTDGIDGLIISSSCCRSDWIWSEDKPLAVAFDICACREDIWSLYHCCCWIWAWLVLYCSSDLLYWSIPLAMLMIARSIRITKIAKNRLLAR